jgi:hypothetical protein
MSYKKSALEKCIQNAHEFLENNITKIMLHYFGAELPYDLDSDNMTHDESFTAWVKVSVDEDTRQKFLHELNTNAKDFQQFFVDIAVAGGFDYPLPEINIPDSSNITIDFIVNGYY